jgi:hypothetical protein
MKARVELIDLAKRNAYKLATRGLSKGEVLAQQPMDPTELLLPSGFLTVTYSAQTGAVSADWAQARTDLERQLLKITKLAIDAEVAKAFVRFWPKLVAAINSPAYVVPAKEVHTHPSFDESEPHIEEAILRRVATDCGLKVTGYKEYPGQYNDSGSGFGGYWARTPSTEMTCEFV